MQYGAQGIQHRVRRTRRESPSCGSSAARVSTVCFTLRSHCSPGFIISSAQRIRGPGCRLGLLAMFGTKAPGSCTWTCTAAMSGVKAMLHPSPPASAVGPTCLLALLTNLWSIPLMAFELAWIPEHQLFRWMHAQRTMVRSLRVYLNVSHGITSVIRGMGSVSLFRTHKTAFQRTRGVLQGKSAQPSRGASCVSWSIQQSHREAMVRCQILDGKGCGAWTTRWRVEGREVSVMSHGQRYLLACRGDHCGNQIPAHVYKETVACRDPCVA